MKSVRQAAVEKLTDQTILVDIAKNDKDWEVCWAAVKKLTDETILADIAKNNKHGLVRSTAEKKLTNKDYEEDHIKQSIPSSPKKMLLSGIILTTCGAG